MWAREVWLEDVVEIAGAAPRRRGERSVRHRPTHPWSWPRLVQRPPPPHNGRCGSNGGAIASLARRVGDHAMEPTDDEQHLQQQDEHADPRSEPVQDAVGRSALAPTHFPRHHANRTYGGDDRAAEVDVEEEQR